MQKVVAREVVLKKACHDMRERLVDQQTLTRGEWESWRPSDDSLYLPSIFNLIHGQR